ncbi:MAG: site-specific DNA-methyltransferase [Psychrobacillus sp.]
MINKLNGESVNITEQNIEYLKELFPEILTDGKKIDFDMLKTILGESVEAEQERYQFTWNGKKRMIIGSQKPSKGTLRPDIEKSKNFDTTENLYIEGDNLEVLKLLQKSYNGKVKVIYIDPPYNTGKDFVYKDNFKDGLQNYLEQTGQVNSNGNILSTNTESNGRFHTDWLNMIYARIKLSRNLLTDDGVIFISIDDSEQSNLKQISDEVFGESNFIGTVIRNTNSTKNQALFLSISHEYCLVYAKNINKLSEKHSNKKWAVDKNNIDEYKKKVNYLKESNISNLEITNELKELTKYPRFLDFTNYWYLDERGIYRKGDLGGVKNGNMDPLFNPLTQKYDAVPPGGYRYSSEKLKKLVEDNRIHFHLDGSLPTIKRYLEENSKQRPKSIMSDDQRPDYNFLKDNNLTFDNPKQLTFMKRIINIMDSDSTILDFFSGSATTAHATMQLNAEDGGNRKFIMIQLPEALDEKSKAYKEGYRTICDIGEERIRRAGEKIKKELQEKQNQAGILDEITVDSESLDVGFKVLKLDTSNIREWNVDFANLENELALYETPFIDNRSELDVVYEIMLKQGLELTYSIETFNVNDQIIYDIAFGSLFICLSNRIKPEIAKAIIERRDEQGTETSSVIFSDSGFLNDSDKLNCIEILKDAGYPEDNLLTI